MVKVSAGQPEKKVAPALAAKLLLMGLEINRLQSIMGSKKCCVWKSGKSVAVRNHLLAAVAYHHNGNLAGMFHLRQAAGMVGGVSYLPPHGMD